MPADWCAVRSSASDMVDLTTPGGATPTVAILLCSKDGKRFLAEQLESIAAQTVTGWRLWISDDGSTDGTLALIEQYRARWATGQISTQPGPGKGVAANFLSLTRNPEIRADFYAFADQDDIWEPDKLARAIAWLRGVSADVPALYGSRTRLIDEQGRELGFSSLIAKPPGFANALAQNVFGGNTMVFNNAARNLLSSADETMSIVAHDWWAYQVVSGCGGRLFWDPHPAIRYRQHSDNQVGSNVSWAGRVLRIDALLKGRYRAWNDLNIDALLRIFPRLTAENQAILNEFRDARSRPLIARLIGIKRSGIRRQSLPGNLALVIAAVLKML